MIHQIQRSVVAVLGGSFDPPTLAHAMIAAELLNKKLVSRILFVPCGDRDDKNLQKFENRLRMLEIMIEGFFPKESPIEISSIEKNGKMIPTYYLMEKLKIIYPNDDLYFVIGIDLVNSLRSWDCSDLLVSQNGFLILNRPNWTYDQNLLPKKHIMMDDFAMNISSTMIRNRISMNYDQRYLGILGLVQKEVIQFISEQQLYFD